MLANRFIMKKIDSYKMHRLENNPKEKEFLEKFIENHTDNSDIDRIVFGTINGIETNRYLTEDEKRVVISTIQWLGSPVGKGFLLECGFSQNVC